jgi:PAT family beta-lactamase induction signal transducer AmpG
VFKIELFRKWRLDKRHFFIVFFLGFSSGLPFTLVGTTLAAWYAYNGLDIMHIGMLTLIGQPYIYKFLWAPFLDKAFFRKMGKRRGWIATTQFLLVMTIISLAFFTPEKHPFLIAFIALCIAFISATQDIAIDAYRADILLPHERGLGATLAVFSYRLATLVSGALALIWAEHYGWSSTFIILALTLLPSIAVNLVSPEPSKKMAIPVSFITPFKALLKRERALSIFLFIFLYKLGEAFTSTSSGITMPFLIQGLGFDLTTIGLTGKGIGIIATILGSFIAGFLMLKVRLYRALMVFGVFQALTNLLFVLLAYVGKKLSLLVIAVLFDNLSAGMGMTALIAFLMAWSDKRYTASQFALLSAISALPRMISGPIAAVIQMSFGWVTLFSFSFISALPALFVLYGLKNVISKSDNEGACS